MTIVRAAWVCPVTAPPIADGWVAIADDRIATVGAAGQPPPSGAVRDLGQVALLPGLVNAHTHLELSWLRDRVPPATDFVDWVKQLVMTRGGRQERLDDSQVIAAATAAANEARAFGTIAVGDISNSLVSVAPLGAAGLRGIVFHELIGFKETTGRLVDDSRALRRAVAARTTDIRVSVCPHAPYSVSAELFQAIRAEVAASDVPITSIHVGESVSELQLLADGTGPWPGMLRFIGAMRDDWQPPGLGPVEYLDRLGVLDARTLVVHGVQLPPASLARLAAIGCTLVTCPRSNQWVGAGVPPIQRFYDAGVAVAVGTDSLASVSDLNLFEELKAMRWLAPETAARTLLASATCAGARALGLDAELGAIAPGKRADLLAIDLPPHVGDVEEHLVSQVAARDIHWVTA